MINIFQKKINRLITNKEPFVLFRRPKTSNIEIWENKQNKTYPRFICNSFDNTYMIEFFDNEVLEIPISDLPDFNVELPYSKVSNSLPYEKYLNLIEKTIDELKSNTSTKKIVISRIKEVKAQNINLSKTLKNIHNHYPNSYVYLRYDYTEGCWIGASPELLLNQNNKLIQTVSLAGTKSIDDEWTCKEYEEQDIVTKYIVSIFQKYADLIDIEGPNSINAGFFDHLKSNINAEIKNEIYLHNLLKDLHPTPAVCGFPKDLAKKFILNNEGYDRTFYTGFMGYENKNKCEYFVNLRCAKIFSNKIDLYVGGGITTNSFPKNEWEETELKSKTIGELIIYN